MQLRKEKCAAYLENHPPRSFPPRRQKQVFAAMAADLMCVYAAPGNTRPAKINGCGEELIHDGEKHQKHSFDCVHASGAELKAERAESDANEFEMKSAVQKRK